MRDGSGILFLLVAASVAIASARAELLQAIAHIQGDRPGTSGNITFSQSDGGVVTIWGKIVGLTPGKHGFHVHEKGDISGGCGVTGGHYNPFKKSHGALTDAERHVGDLGNINASPDGVALISITDNVISLTGPYTILGRSIVVHSSQDDLGKGGFADSLKTGHAGSRVACGVIGVLTPVDRWEDSSSSASSALSPALPALAIAAVAAVVHRLVPLTST